MRRPMLAWLLPLLLLPVASAAQQVGIVTGRVTDEGGQPLAGVQLVIQGTGLGTLSTPNGRYQIQRVPVGAQTVRATYVGYATTSKPVTVTAGSIVTADLQLKVEAVALEGIVAVG